jgi:hypothetical protein
VRDDENMTLECFDCEYIIEGVYGVVPTKCPNCGSRNIYIEFPEEDEPKVPKFRDDRAR